MTGEPWLLELAEKGLAQREVAARLLRMQVLTASRSGHVLILGWQPQRDAIVHAARWGSVAGIVVSCDDCHCQALLSEWERAAKLTKQERKAAWTDLRTRRPRHTLLYLTRCPGAEIAGYMRESTSATPTRED